MKINPRLEKMAHDAFKKAFGDDFNILNREHHKLMLAHAAMLEMGADYVRLRLFEKVFNHLIEIKEIEHPVVNDKLANYEDSIKEE